jgi:hypothetical protein
VRRQRRGRERMIQSEPITARAVAGVRGSVLPWNQSSYLGWPAEAFPSAILPWHTVWSGVPKGGPKIVGGFEIAPTAEHQVREPMDSRIRSSPNHYH